MQHQQMVAFQLQLLQKYEHYELLILHFWSQRIPHTFQAAMHLHACELCLQTPITEGIDISQTYKLCYTYRNT